MYVCGVGFGVAVIVTEVIAIVLVIVEGFWLKILCGTESISESNIDTDLHCESFKPTERSTQISIRHFTNSK